MAQTVLSMQANATDPDLLRAIGGQLMQSFTNVTAVHLKHLKVAAFTDITPEKVSLKASDIENAIRQQKLREALLMKQELEDKLAHVKGSIEIFEMLQQSVEEPSPKKNLLDKQVRVDYYEDMQRRQQQAALQAKKHIAEQLERKRRIEDQHRKQRELMLTEDEILQQRKQERQAADEEQKQARIKAMQDNLAQRRAERERLMKIGMEELTKVKASKPLHLQLEEKYTQEVLMPELEKHKAELAKKRVHFNSVTRQELQEHAQRYETLKRESMERRSHQANESILDHMTNLASKNASKFTYAVIEEERKLKDETRLKADEKHRMAEKKRQYASLIKEMYAPSIDLNKKTEIEERRLKHSTAPPKKQRAGSDKSQRSGEGSPLPSTASWVPRKFKPNPLVSVPPPRRKSVKVDYLGDRRRERDTSEVKVSSSLRNIDLEPELHNLSEKETALRLIQKAQKIERAAKRQELGLNSGVKSVTHVEVMGSVNDALVSSVKAKLALLEAVTRK